MNWNRRSYQKELLDRDDIPFAAIKRNMEELDVINRRLGGHAITLKGLQAILAKLFQNPMLEGGPRYTDNRPQQDAFRGPSSVDRGRFKLFQTPIFANQTAINEAEYYLSPSPPGRAGEGPPISILEIGCGGGDNLRVIKDWAAKKNLPVRLTGVDINGACIGFAKAHPRNAGIDFICADYKTVSLPQHVIFSSLFCHHFVDTELVQMLRWMRLHASAGFFINDLHRHPAAYYSIKTLTRLFSKSYLVRHDAPLSVLRGFSRSEWHQLFQKAMLTHYRIQWQWAFRWLITCTN